jgi:ABC-type antimicrobial peptide transport system permease subunit
MALGARPGDVLAMVFRYAGILLGAGLAIGFAGALAAGKLIAAQLFDVRATDPLTYALVAAALLLTGVIASAVPAIRATRVDPLVALREE